MHLITLAATATAAVLSVVSPTTITVKVGENNGLMYDPANATAAVGDKIVFQFFAKNHTVTQSTFADSCQQMYVTTIIGINSGFQAIAANTLRSFSFSFLDFVASSPMAYSLA
ncbi:hypothetical protein B0H10DRAFT_2206425 [Mycena sp. CBHHK59/15]|nr:hypothetical protein B0H10DRAFT_2206425 [Mycena sp. CBHHK59/15]